MSNFALSEQQSAAHQNAMRLVTLQLEDPRPSPDRPSKPPLAPIPEPEPHLPNPEIRTRPPALGEATYLA